MFKITLQPIELNKYNIYVAHEHVSSIESNLPFEELQVEYELPNVWRRYMDDWNPAAETDVEIMTMVLAYAELLRLTFEGPDESNEEDEE